MGVSLPLIHYLHQEFHIMTMSKRVQQGFTLIELMIVVAIIGILAAVAIPQYKDYTAKAKVGNAITAADSFKKAVALCGQEEGALTNCNNAGILSAATFTPTNEVVSGTITGSGVIELTMAASTKVGNELGGKKITFTPALGNSAVTWKITTDVATGTPVYDAIVKNSTGT
jgi:type IV pilus assembly protein PilA